MSQFDDKAPIYLQIVNMIKSDVIAGKLKEGEKLPSVREMGEKLKVNPNTIQRAYQELEREDVAFTQRGMGTFITEDKEKIANLKKEMASNLVTWFMRSMKEFGFSEKEIVEIIFEYVNEGD